MSLTLDAGALIAFERQDREVLLYIARSVGRGERVLIPAGVIGQVWRDGRRQPRLARLLGAPQTTVVPLDDRRARVAGQLCGLRGTSDVIDASVAIIARETDSLVITSDPDDLLRLDSTLDLMIC